MCHYICGNLQLIVGDRGEGVEGGGESVVVILVQFMLVSPPLFAGCWFSFPIIIITTA